MDQHAHLVYKITSSFPSHEIYGLTSQLRRSALSVVLNYIEGYAINYNKIYKNFLKISYGSLKESQYLIHFSLIERLINQQKYNEIIKLADKIGAMFWPIMKR